MADRSTNIMEMKNNASKTHKTRTKFSFFDNKEAGRYQCNKGIRILSQGMSARLPEEDNGNELAYCF